MQVPLRWKLEGYIGDEPKDLRLQLFADADFASDLSTRKSTSGLFLPVADPTASSRLQR